MNTFVKQILLLATLLLTGCGLLLGFVWLLPSDEGAPARPFTPFLAGSLLVLILLFLCWLLVKTLAGKLPAVSLAPGESMQRPIPPRSDAGGNLLRLAYFRYHVNDPGDPQSFAIFLDEPIFLLEVELELGHDDTPFQVIEDALVNYARQVEHVHQNQLIVEVSLGRGSLTIGLTILAAYQFLAQYHDFVESVHLLQQQIGRLLREVTHWYRTLTGGELHVQSDITIDSPTVNPGKREEAGVNHTAPGAPSVTIHNTVASPASTPAVQVWIHPTPVWATLWGCVTAGLMLILLVLMALFFTILWRKAHVF